MKSGKLIRRIRNYSLISFLLPLIAINLCLFIFQILGNNDLYNNFNWDDKLDYTPKEYLLIDLNENFSFTNCPKNKYTFVYITSNNEVLSRDSKQKLFAKYSLNEDLESFEKLKINAIKLNYQESKNDRCIKNNKFSYFFLKAFKPLENLLINTKKNKISGFGKIKNPYFYGEVSISRTARYFPATFIFKPLIILSGIFLLFYWINNFKLFNEFKNSNIIENFSKKFIYFGVLSCIFLILHASFLGLDYNSKIFSNIRKAIIILFIVFEVTAQIFLTMNLLKFKDKIKNHINIMILKTKVFFVITVLAITFVVSILLIFSDLGGSTKHILEWNYFSILLIYYLLSRVLWKY